MVKESTTVRLYVDGVEFISTTSFPNNVPSGSNYLGADVSVSNRIFDGIIDEVIVMDRAVCANQITAMFNDDVDSYTTINQCETNCGETWTLNSTPNILGDEGTPTLSSPVSIPSLSIATQPVDGVDVSHLLQIP